MLAFVVMQQGKILNLLASYPAGKTCSNSLEKIIVEPVVFHQMEQYKVTSFFSLSKYWSNFFFNCSYC